MGTISKKIADRKMQVLALLIALVACVGFGGGLFAFFTDNASIADGVEMHRQTATVRYIYADDCNNEQLGFSGMDGKAVTRGEAGVARVESADADEAYTVRVEAYYDGANWQLRNDEGEWSTEPQPIASPKLSKAANYAGQDVNVRFVPDYTSVTVTAATDATTGADSMDSDLDNVAGDKYRSTTESTDADGNLVVTIVYHAAFRTASAEVDYRYSEKSKFVDSVSGKVASDLRGHAVTRADAGAAESDADDADTAYVVPVYGLQTVSDGIHQWDADKWGGDTGWNAWQVLSPSMAIASPTVAIDVKVGEYQSNFAFGNRATKDDVREIAFTPDMDRVNVAFATSGTPGADVRTDVYEDDVKIADALTACNILSKERSASADAAGDAIAIFDFSVLDGAIITVFYSPITSEEYVLETGNALLTHLNQLGTVSNVEFGLYTNYPQFVEAFKNKEGVAVAVDAAGNLTYTDGKVTGYKSRAALTSTKANSYNIQLFYDRDTGTAYILTKERMIANPDCSQMFGSKSDFGDIDWYLGWNGNNNVSMSVRNIEFNSWRVDDGKVSWDISNGFGFDTVLVEDLDYMFANLKGYDGGLETLNLGTWINGLPNARTVEDMFYGSSYVTTLNLSDSTFATTDKLRYVSGMFMGCEKLKSVNLKTMDLSGVASVCEGEHNYEQEGMFENCHALESIDVSSWNTSGVTDMRDMFRCCWSLGDLDLSGWDVSSVTTMANMFNMSAVDGDPDNAYAQYGPVTLNITGWNTASLESMYRMFSGCNKTSKITGIGDLNTENVATMHGTFQNAGVTEMDLSKWNVSKVTTMENMFRACEKLTKLDLHGWNTAALTNIGHNASSTMFWNCNALTELDVSGWTNPQLTSIEGLFNGLTWLKTLKATNFNTAGVTNMVQLFHGCSHLTSIDLSTWDTSKVENMFAMFRNTLRLENVNLTGSFSTANVTNMREMFCITTDGIRTTPVLDLRNFNTSNVTNMYMMFNGQNKLQTIYATDEFVVNSGTTTRSMFDECAVLAGGYNMTSPIGNFGNKKSSTDGTYAKVDREDQEGYFTEPRPEGDIPVTGVAIAYGDDIQKSGNGKIKMGVGGTLQLTAVIEPEDATNQNVTWSSSDKSVVTVDENGLVTCVGTGVNPTITATTQDGRYTASVGFYPNQANLYRPMAIKLFDDDENVTGSEIDLTQRDTTVLAGVLSPLGSSYTGAWTWTSSDSNVAAVDNGTIEAVNPGTATVTASISWGAGKNDTRTASVTVNVYGDKEITDLSLDKRALSLSYADGVPQVEKLTATLAPYDAKKTDLTWTSSDTSVATVDGKGNVTSTGVGAATITVSGAGFTASCEVFVSNYVALQDVAIGYGDTVQKSGQKLKIGVGGTIQLAANVTPVNASVASVSWKSDSASNVSVDAQTGLIKGEKTGGNANITVTVTDANGVTRNAKVTVSPDTARNCVITGVSLDKGSLELAVGGIGELSYQLAPEGYTTFGGGITWSSSDESVATVENGTVTAVGPGAATITVTATTMPFSKVNTYTATCTVTVAGGTASSNSGAEDAEPEELAGQIEGTEGAIGDVPEEGNSNIEENGTSENDESPADSVNVGAADGAGKSNEQAAQGGGEADAAQVSDMQQESPDDEDEEDSTAASAQGGEGQAGSSDAGAAGDSSGSEGSDASGGTNAITTQSTGARSAALADAGFVGGNVAYASTSDERAAKGSQVIEDEATPLAKGSANSMNVWLLAAVVVTTMVSVVVMGYKRAATHASARSGVPGSEGGRDA